MGFRVVLDTCVLVPAALRDTLLRAAVRDLYELYWSDEILSELERVLVREEMVISSDKAKYLRTTLENQFPRAKVPESYKALIPVMENDEKDRHVLAAAVRINAQTIVTENTRDFPEEALAPYGIEAQTPDTFLVHLYNIEPDDMCESIIQQAQALKYGNYTVVKILDGLGQEAPTFAALIRDRMFEITRFAEQLKDLESP